MESIAKSAILNNLIIGKLIYFIFFRVIASKNFTILMNKEEDLTLY